MDDNVIPFPTNDNDPPEETIVKIIIRNTGRCTIWTSEGIETEEQIEWTKRIAFDVMYSLGDILGCGVAPVTDNGFAYEDEIE